MKEFNIVPIGYVHKDEENHYLEILPEYSEGLFRLEQISHVFVLWWIHENDFPEARMVSITEPRVSSPPVPVERMGTFAMRTPRRPNPVGLTLVKIRGIKGNRILVDEIDAFEGTPIIDIKPYLPNGDRVDDQVHLPPWFEHLLISRDPDKRIST